MQKVYVTLTKDRVAVNRSRLWADDLVENLQPDEYQIIEVGVSEGFVNIPKPVIEGEEEEVNYGTIEVSTWPELAALIHRINVDKGFWSGGVESRNVGEALCLVHSEISEAHEAFLADTADDKLPQHSGFEVEIGDALIRVLDLGHAYGLGFTEATEELKAFVHDEDMDVEDILGLLHMTVSKVLEAHRKGGVEAFKEALEVLFQILVETVEKFGIDHSVILDKVQYNAGRPFLHGKAY